MRINTAVCYSFSLNTENPMAHLRLIGPLGHAGIKIINGIENNQIHINCVSEGDIVIIQREFSREIDSYKKIMEFARKEGKPVVFDLDDLLLFLPENHPDRENSEYGPSLLPMLQALMQADLVSVATPKLRDFVINYNKNITVLPNFLDETLWQLRSPVLRSSDHDVLTIGYMGGNSHGPDLEFIAPVLIDLLSRYPQRIRLQFWGVRPPAVLISLPQVNWTSINIYNYKEFSSFFQTQAADIFVAPLMDNIFNRCKSPIKFLEYSALGAPGVFSHLETYSDIVAHGKNGFLASSLDEWTDCLVQLIEDHELRFTLAENAQKMIRSDWLLSRNAFRWKEAFQNANEVNPLNREQNSHIVKVIDSINQQLGETFNYKQAISKEMSVRLSEKEAAVQALSNQLTGKEKQVQVLTAQVAEKEKDVQALIEQVAKKEHEGQALVEQVAMKEQQVQDLTRQLSEITASKAWRVVMMIRRIRLFLLPSGSLRMRLAKKILAILLFPLSIRRLQRIKRDFALVRDSGLFDPSRYLADNPDVRQANVDPLVHFMNNGWKEGRNPSPLFNVMFYLDSNFDVKASGINPLIHYIKFGKKEGRQPTVNGKIGEISPSVHKNSIEYKYTPKDQKEESFNNGNISISSSETKTILQKIRNYYKDYGARALISKVIRALYKSIKLPKNSQDGKHVFQYYEMLYTGQSINENEYVPYSDEYVYSNEADVKLIAFYLPQFHPIPENDEWWGKGFTEWTNVSKAIPNFRGHYQPHLPGELGFYDLRILEVQKRQIELARNYGIYGFCFHYYWFNGKRLLERPLNQFLENPDLDFPFCICWANENWTRRWDGLEDEILIGQTHSEDEYLAFIKDIIPLFLDKRYIRVNGKPLLVVYRVSLLPNPQQAAEIWRSECRKMGIEGIYLVAAQSFGITDPRTYGFDAAVEFPPHNLWPTQIDKAMVQVTNPSFTGRIFDYSKAVQMMKDINAPEYTLFRTVMPSWDNTARKQNDGYVFINSTPSAYKDWLGSMVSYTKRILPGDKRFVFINSWNEWGEGAYLEPDRLYGYAYLQATAEANVSLEDRRSKIIPKWTILFVSHDACRGGAQTALINTITWFKKYTSLTLKILCLDGGILLTDFKKMADTVVLSEFWQGGDETPNEELIDRLFDFCGGTPELIYGNTVVSGRAYPLLRKLGAPILTHVHELESSIQYYASEWMGDVLEYSKHFLACSGAVRDNLVRSYGVPAKKITIAHASILEDLKTGELGKKEKENLKKELGLVQGKHLIFGCGYGMPFRKGADLFIKLGEILHCERRDDFHLYWIGGFDGTETDEIHGSWSKYLRNLENSSLRKFVTFLGFKKNPRDYLKVGDMFVLPSREEPFGLVVLEAADCGLPTICFTNAGAADFVGEDAGYIVADEDVEAMALKLLSLIRDEDLRQKLGNRAREKLLAGFTTERTTPQILPVCRKVAKQKPAVSVIVPNYNHAQYLPQRLESIFKQTYQDFEVILLDDASSDESLEVLEKYAGRGDVQILRNDLNTGTPFKQWIKGIDLAKSDILWIAESDDLCAPEFLRTLLPAFNDPKVKLAYVNSHIIDEKGTILGDYLSSPYLVSLSPTKWQKSYKVSSAQEINDGLGVKDTILNASAVLFRKFELDKGFRDVFSGMRIAGDWYFVVNAIKDGAIKYDAKKLNYHRRHSGSVIGKILQEKKLERFFQEFCLVQKYIFNNYKLAPEFPEKWEAYLRQQWDEFFPNRSFEELKEYYPFEEMKKKILNSIAKSK